MNLLIWYSYNEQGEIESIVRFEAFHPSFDVDKHFVKFMEGHYAGGGVDRIVREYIHVPARLHKVEGTAYVLYVNGKRFRAALPYFTTLTPGTDRAGGE